MHDRPSSKLSSRSPSIGLDNEDSVNLGDKYLTNLTDDQKSNGSDYLLLSDHCYEKIDIKMKNLNV